MRIRTREDGEMELVNNFPRMLANVGTGDDETGTGGGSRIGFEAEMESR
jgi:hypothetical protein